MDIKAMIDSVIAIITSIQLVLLIFFMSALMVFVPPEFLNFFNLEELSHNYRTWWSLSLFCTFIWLVMSMGRAIPGKWHTFSIARQRQKVVNSLTEAQMECLVPFVRDSFSSCVLQDSLQVRQLVEKGVLSPLPVLVAYAPRSYMLSAWSEKLVRQRIQKILQQ
jgi:hypothetical protein